MGEYNPNRPVLLGNEWPGISYEPYPIDSEAERGHTFRLDTSTTVVTGAFYIDKLPGALLTYASPMISIYRTGEEASTGPVRKVIIPANGGANITGTVFIYNASSIAEALATAGDNRYLSYHNDDVEHSIFFDVNSYSAELSGKRILNYAFLYSAIGAPPDSKDLYFNLEIRGIGLSSEINFLTGLEVAPEATITPKISRVDLGNTNMFTTGNLLEGRKYPMRYQDLQRFASGGSPQISFVIDALGYGSPENVYLTYAGLEVTYCEENRIAYGGRSPYPAGAASNYWPLNLNYNIVHIRSVSAFTPGVTLTPGEYTVTLTLGSFSPEWDAGAKPTINALRQLYALSTHNGVQIVRTLESGRTPIKTEVDVLPQISLHTSSAIVTGVHGYGRLVPTPVYHNVNATQIILQHSGGTAVSYPYIRFYARRFGNTNVPLTVTDINTTLGSASISPGEFDALPEIIAGWREVTLELSPPASMNNNDAVARFTWSATNLLAGNQWEVLAVDAPGGMSSAHDIANATYAKTLGLTWNSVLDPSADVVAMLAQEPTSITSFSVTQETQVLTSIAALECVDPKCMPTGIIYNEVSWVLDDVICDSFNDRVEASTWGNTETGEAWVTSGGSASDYSVSGDVARQSLGSVNVYRSSVVNTGENAFHVNTTFSWSISNAVGGNITNWTVGRYVDASNYYCLRLNLSTSSGQVTAEIIKRVAGTITSLTSAITVGQNIANDLWDVTFEGVGTVLNARIQNKTTNSTSVPIQAVDLANSLPTGTYVGVLNRVETGNTNTLPVVVTYYNFMWAKQTLDGGIELQRRDEEDTDWKTIMRSSTFCARGFNDYEARVGVQTFYRARTFHTYDFYGDWTSNDGINTTILTPGITGAQDGNSVLIFTSNESQDGAYNLAYTMTWDGDVTEDYTFPEADAVELRQLYRRDYAMAFHPTERGGEQFSRVLLVNNAGVATRRVTDGFRSLRDMAWANLSYVCVRNELGDRWLAWVKVPSGKIQRNRRLYLARVDIGEVTDTPTQIDPTE